MTNSKVQPPDISRVRDAVAGMVEEYHLPGIAVGVVAGDDLVWAEGFGYADIESHRPQGPGLRQRIGSITKTMLALCAMALVDERRLALDDRVVERLPGVRLNGHGDTLTVRHLVTHTGGIGEIPTMADRARQDGALWAEVGEAIPPVAESYPNGIDVEVPPGTKWAYANHGFALLGEIVSRIEGASVAEAFRRRVFEPLRMKDSDGLDQPHPDLSTGYHRAPTDDDLELRRRAGMADPPPEEPVDGYNIRGRYQLVRMPAAGAVQSTIPDMARYASALMRKGAGIVRPDTFDAMITPQYNPDPRLMSIGLPFFRQWQFGTLIFEHGGGVVGGWNTHLGVAPEEGLALLIHLNMSTAEFEKIISRIWQAVLGAPDVVLDEAPLDASVRATAPGLYEAAPGTLTNFRIITALGRVRIEPSADGLVFRARRGPYKDGVRMLRGDPSDGCVLALDTGDPQPPLIVLQTDAAGKVSGLRMNRLIHLLKVQDAE